MLTVVDIFSFITSIALLSDMYHHKYSCYIGQVLNVEARPTDSKFLFQYNVIEYL